MRRIFLFLATFLFTGAVLAEAASVPYPKGYRSWHHVKSIVSQMNGRTMAAFLCGRHEQKFRERAALPPRNSLRCPPHRRSRTGRRSRSASSSRTRPAGAPTSSRASSRKSSLRRSDSRSSSTIAVALRATSVPSSPRSRRRTATHS